MHTRVAMSGLVVAVMLIGCDNPSPALVKYEQRGACNGFTSDGVATTAGPNRAYVVFRISTVSNTGSKPVDFNFDPARLYVDQSNPTAYVDPNLRLSTVNPFIPQGRLVKAGTTESFNGAVVAIVSTQDGDGAKEAAQTKYKLLYSALGKPGALTEDNAPGTSGWGYTPNCADVMY